MRWNKGAACALVVAALAASAPSAAATTTSEACRDGDRRSAQAIDGDIRVIDDDGWYYVATQGGPSYWKESNEVPGLQTEARVCDVSEIDGTRITLLYSYVKWEPDTRVAATSAGWSGVSAYACYLCAL